MKMYGNEITWYIGSPLNEAVIIIDNDQPYTRKELQHGVKIDLLEPETKPVLDIIWNQRLKINKGDKLHLAPFDDKVLYTIPTKVKTLYDMMYFINKKLNEVIPKKYQLNAIGCINGFLNPVDRMKYLEKLENNTLKWIDINGDYWRFTPFKKWNLDI